MSALVSNILAKLSRPISWLIPTWSQPQTISLLKPQFYPEIGDIETRKARAALQKNDWRPAEILLAGITNINDFEFLLDLITAAPCPRAPLEAWTEEQPENGLAWLARGIHSGHWAWEARGRGVGSTVTPQGQKHFIERLKFSVQELTRAAKLRPKDPTPWGYLMRAALGLDEIREKLDTLLREVRRRDPQAVIPHVYYLTNKCAKWYGSHEEMLSFARKAAAQAGEGSDMHVLVAMAHRERQSSFYCDDEHEQGDEYFLQPRIRAEILLAYHNSLGSPKYVAHHATIEYRNHFMLCLHECALNQFAQKELLLMNGHLSRIPWAYFNDPLAYYHSLVRSMRLG